MTSRVDSAQLHALIVQILARAGVPTCDANQVAGCLVFADLRGTTTHGVIRLAHYIDRLDAGGVNPRPQIQVVSRSSATTLVDGDNGFGAVVGAQAMGLAIEQGAQTGVGLVVARNLNHFGAAGYYAAMAADRGLIGIATGNVPGLMAPTGGRHPMIGNNPLAIAFPSLDRPPILWDSAMSRSSWGALVVAAQNGHQLPEGAFLSAEGMATRDPDEVLAGGSLVPIAGYKGYGLALCLGLLTGVLSSGPFDAELPHPYRQKGEPGRNATTMIVVDPGVFRDPSEFVREVERVGEMVTRAPARADADRVWLPGEKEAEIERERLRSGIPLPAHTFSELEALAKRFGVGHHFPAPVTHEDL
jgi:L-2-hydroxycarboxylate dehydrogenase (NAD+)